MREFIVGVIQDNGEADNSPNFKYLVKEWVDELRQKLGHSVQDVIQNNANKDKLGQKLGRYVQVVVGNS